ncbi:hypothetical protein VNO78_29005 [Psophocarpus tetragonolobus]|uniref:Uncharacterized protein n=1 Tax=Psophocarpus tetragonolobus TaxID=3891 RepID=A0AAN9RUG2_PSOTE
MATLMCLIKMGIKEHYRTEEDGVRKPFASKFGGTEGTKLPFGASSMAVRQCGLGSENNEKVRGKLEERHTFGAKRPNFC